MKPFLLNTEKNVQDVLPNEVESQNTSDIPILKSSLLGHKISFNNSTSTTEVNKETTDDN